MQDNHTGNTPIVFVVDDTTSQFMRKSPVISNDDEPPVAHVRLHQVKGNDISSTYELPLPANVNGIKRGRCNVQMALGLLADQELPNGCLIVAGPNYGCSRDFLQELGRRKQSFLVEIRPSTVVNYLEGGREPMPAATVLKRVHPIVWNYVEIRHPVTSCPVKYSGATLGSVELSSGAIATLWIIQTGAIQGIHRGTFFVLTSIINMRLEKVLETVGWARWIKPYLRKQARPSRTIVPVNERGQVDVAGLKSISSPCVYLGPREMRRNRTLNVVELFAGAGGMGLGFLMANRDARRYKVHYSGEVHPVYVHTLRRNHQQYVDADPSVRNDLIPSECNPVDLRTIEGFETVLAAVSDIDRLDVLIGGPPCQGFSNANRNSGHGANPNNRLVDTYVEYVKRLSPKVFIMENVQGILSCAKPSADQPLSVLQYVATELRRAGYLVFPKLIDAAWFGVPQHRQRFFVVGLHVDVGYSKGDFDSWGPFPRPTHGPTTDNPFVTVHDAIYGLPEIPNGATADEMPYCPSQNSLESNEYLRLMRDGAGDGAITDHVTSKHADYVIERYRAIPHGGNWEDISNLLTNYANVGRTHSNIYRRLEWNLPAITIGHYRKSMLVHPSQHRGLSLREASRLQSFPDWFRFAGAENAGHETLGHKQQQLANAVCPLVSMALAEYLFGWIL